MLKKFTINKSKRLSLLISLDTVSNELNILKDVKLLQNLQKESVFSEVVWRERAMAAYVV